MFWQFSPKRLGKVLLLKIYPKSEQESGQQSGISNNENTIGKDHLVMIEPSKESKKDLKKENPLSATKKTQLFSRE